MLTTIWSCKDYSQVMWLDLLKRIYNSTCLKKKAPTFSDIKSCYICLLHAWTMVSYMAFTFFLDFLVAFLFCFGKFGVLCFILGVLKFHQHTSKIWVSFYLFCLMLSFSPLLHLKNLPHAFICYLAFTHFTYPFS